MEKRRHSLKTSKIFLVLFSMLLVAAILLAGCGKTTSSTQTQTSTSGSTTSTNTAAQYIKIGSLAPTDGPYAAMGLAMHHLLNIWADDFNKAGGITVNGVKYLVQTHNYDNGSWDPAVSLKSFQQATTQDGVNFVIMAGHNITTTNIAEWSKTLSFKTLIFAWGVTTADGPNTPNVLGYTGWPCTHVPMFTWIAKDMANTSKKVYLMTPSGAAYSVDNVAWEEIGADTTGFTTLGLQQFDMAATDYSPIMAPVVAAKPDLIYQGTGGAGAHTYSVEAARELGYTGKFFMQSMDYATMAQQVPADYIEGIYAGYGDWDKPSDNAGLNRIHQYYNEFIAKYPGQWVGDANLELYAAEMLITGIKLSNSVDPGKVEEALLAQKTIDHPLLGQSVWGGQELYGANRFLMTPYVIAQVKNKQIVNVGVQTWTDWASNPANMQKAHDILQKLGGL